MYRFVLEQCPGSWKYLLCDVVAGSLNRIVRSHTVFSALESLGLRHRIVLTTEKSYSVQNLEGQTEQFERVLVARGPVKQALRLWRLGVCVWQGAAAALPLALTLLLPGAFSSSG
eukprot:m.279315 g.279315  ORF g.279315 m.279315 type:complete len:115 (+) comp22881_c0_seq28:4934-5278(+)